MGAQLSCWGLKPAYPLLSTPHLCPSSFRPYLLLCEEQEWRLWADKTWLPLLDGKSSSLVDMFLGVPLLYTGAVLCPHQLPLWALRTCSGGNEARGMNVVGVDL